jgi:hypothetical protein
MIISVKKDNIDGVFRSYKMTLSSGQIWFVPFSDEANTHYQEIMEWEKEEGNTIEEAD